MEGARLGGHSFVDRKYTNLLVNHGERILDYLSQRGPVPWEGDIWIQLCVDCDIATSHPAFRPPNAEVPGFLHIETPCFGKYLISLTSILENPNMFGYHQKKKPTKF